MPLTHEIRLIYAMFTLYKRESITLLGEEIVEKSKRKPKSSFRLLVPAEQQKGEPSIELCGGHWSLVDFPEMLDAPPYTCVSYSWRTERVENVFKGGQPISSRAIPVTETAIRASRSSSTIPDTKQAIWVDSLCMPHEDSARRACLSSMGAIYGAASQVIVVLSTSCASALRKFGSVKHMTDDELFALENDTWITRAWTYQEAANAKKFLFVAEGDDGISVDAEDFLNMVMMEGSILQGTPGVVDISLCNKYPNISKLQDMIAEWKASDIWSRPAFQVISAICSRQTEAEGDIIYPMIGAISDKSLNRLQESALSPAEFFMQECESMGDYSFIFCTEPRSKLPGKCWRPAGQRLTALVSGVLTVGRGLSGCQEGDRLRLHDMCLMSTKNSHIGLKNLLLRNSSDNKSSQNCAKALFQRLDLMQYTGSGDCIETDNGHFFPLHKAPLTGKLIVAASKEVFWDGGGPALLLRSRDDGTYEFYDVGVFSGRLPEDRKSIEVT